LGYPFEDAALGIGETILLSRIFLDQTKKRWITSQHKCQSATMASAPLHFIPRFLLPRGPFILRPHAHLYLTLTASLRYASSNNGARPRSLAEQLRNKQPVIPQPDKYRPPSHGRRTPRSETQQKSYGPKLSAEDRDRMRTKKYPNMMSPEGTFSHWFLNNKVIHLWITMVWTLLTH
jgi:hypothetical protein